MKKNMKNESTNENTTAETTKKELSMFELMKMIDHNTKKIEKMSIKIDRIQNLNEELKQQLKSKIENI